MKAAFALIFPEFSLGFLSIIFSGIYSEISLQTILKCFILEVPLGVSIIVPSNIFPFFEQFQQRLTHFFQVIFQNSLNIIFYFFGGFLRNSSWAFELVLLDFLQKFVQAIVQRFLCTNPNSSCEWIPSILQNFYETSTSIFICDSRRYFFLK